METLEPDTNTEITPESEAPVEKPATAPRNTRFQIKQMELGELFDTSLKLYLGHFKEIVGAAAVATIPLVTLIMFLRSQAEARIIITQEDIAMTFFLLHILLPILLLTIIFPLQVGATSLIISDIYTGNNYSITKAYSGAFKQWGRLIGTGFLYLFAAIFPWPLVHFIFIYPIALIEELTGVSAFVILHYCDYLLCGYTFYALVRFYLFPYTVVIEKLTAVEALAKIGTLVVGNWIKLLFITFIIVVIDIMTFSTINFIGSRVLTDISQITVVTNVNPYFQILFHFLNMIIFSFATVVTVLFYYDLRVRKEGFDLERLAEEIIR